MHLFAGWKLVKVNKKMHFYLVFSVKSKNKKSILIMQDCLNEFFIYQKKTMLKKHKVLKINLLKSPHIHKKAQHHFEQNIYKITFVFLLKLSIILWIKQFIKTLFQDNYFNCKFIYNNNYLNFVFWFLNFTMLNYQLKTLKKETKSKLIVVHNYLKFINLLGQLILKN